ncbi:MAG: DUF2310 family Zn-ribbon-containing protein [Verrucomicrobia bacterium]|nr:DUF2310 family Zn-ribbon-containing protein [Verrucomicrobiota bacterium]
MFNAEVRFVARHRGLTEKLVEAVWNYAPALRRNGQLANDYSVSRKGTKVRLVCIIPEKCSMESRFHDVYGKAALRRLVRLTAGSAVTKVAGEAEDTGLSCLCLRRPSVHFFTNFLHVASPLGCGGCRRTIPFYRLRGLSHESRDGLLCWQWAYQACDDLFMHTGFGERWGYGQLSRLDSGLTAEGLKLRGQLENELKLPVFYYLHRYWGRSEAAERKRRCPGCGGAWLLPKPDGCFEFRCERCRLLSSQAPDFKSSATTNRLFR